MNRTVYATGNSGFVAKAASFGNINIIAMGEYGIPDTPRLYSQIYNALILSDKDDYLLCIHSPNIAALCMAVWFELHHQVNMLIWDDHTLKFVVHKLTKSEIRMGIEHTKDRLGRVLLRDSRGA